MARRLIITAGWFAAAILAVLVGLLALTVIGDGLTTPVRPLSQSEVARELAGQPTSAAPPASPSTTPASPSASPSASTGTGSGPVSRSTRGGTVIARCSGGQPQLVTMTPADGFEVHEQGGTEGEFRGVSDNHNRVKVKVGCAGDGRAVVNVTSRS